jgi:hypothetical protein
MASESELRPGVIFRKEVAGAGSIEFAKGRRFDHVSFLGTLPGTTDEGARAHVNVLSAIYPTSPDKVTKSEHLPVMVVVPAETRYLKGDREILASLFFLGSMLDGGSELDLGRTVVLTLHGSAEVGEDDQLMAGNPTLPSVKPDRWITLNPPAVATLVRRLRGPEGQRPNVVVNTGCFSSTCSGRKKGTTFNEELAALLAEDGVTIYGPPYAGIVTSATWLGRLCSSFRQVYSRERNERARAPRGYGSLVDARAQQAAETTNTAFGQQLEDDATIREVPIKFQSIAPATRRRWREARTGRRATTLHGSVVITNDYALAGEVCSFWW